MSRFLKRKKMLLSIVGVTTFAVVIALSLEFSRTDGKVDLVFSNIQILAENESGPNCDNTNGYRKFKSEKGSNAYDCCYVWRDGDGQEDCQ